jgi:hypothetical protein
LQRKDFFFGRLYPEETKMADKKWTEKYTGKPEDAYMGLPDDAMMRIANVASHNMPRSDVLSEGRLEGYESYSPEPSYEDDDFMPRGAGRKSADFSRIPDPESRRLARTLYGAQEEDSIEIENSAYFFYPDDLAILRVQAGREGDVVRIKTFENEEDLYQSWADITGAADR